MPITNKEIEDLDRDHSDANMRSTAWNTRAAMPEPMRCAECDCGNPPHDCNWIKPGPYAAIREDKT